MIKKIYLLLPLFLSLLLISCDNEGRIDPDAFIKDDAGNYIKKDFNPKKVISLAPNITEAIYALNADSLLVGVTDYCDYPPEAKKKEKVGTLLDPNIEKITALAPDIIIMTMEGNSKYTYLNLKSSGFKVFVSNPNDISGIQRMMVNLGQLLGKKNEGMKIAEKIGDEQKYFKLENRDKKKIPCFLIISQNPLITVNRFTYISEILDLAGFENIYGEELLEYPNITYEDAIIKNPDYIICLSDTINKTLTSEAIAGIKSNFSTVNAVKNNKVFAVDENIFSRPGPRVMECVNLLKLKVF